MNLIIGGLIDVGTRTMHRWPSKWTLLRLLVPGSNPDKPLKMLKLLYPDATSTRGTPNPPEFKEGAELTENGSQYKIFGLVLPEIILTPVFMEAKLSSE